MICHERMAFAYSESARLVRSALGAVLRQRREATRRTLTEVAGEAGLSPAHLSEVERGRKEGSTHKRVGATPGAAAAAPARPAAPGRRRGTACALHTAPRGAEAARRSPPNGVWP